MTRILMLFVLLIGFNFVTPVYAEEVRVGGLSEQQAAEVKLYAAKMKNEAKNPTDVAERLSEYAEIGQKYGIALAATAKELGVAADELLDTTVGKVALVLIVWKVMGSELIGLLIGVPWIIIGGTIWFYLFRKMAIIKAIEYTPIENRWYRKKTVTYHNAGTIDATRWGLFLTSVIVWLPGLIMIFG